MIHFHKYEIVNAQIRRIFDGYDRVNERPIDVLTSVLNKCSVCGKIKVQNIPGPWTLDQLLELPPTNRKGSD